MLGLCHYCFSFCFSILLFHFLYVVFILVWLFHLLFLLLFFLFCFCCFFNFVCFPFFCFVVYYCLFLLFLSSNLCWFVFFFYNGPIQPFIHLFPSFQTQITIFTTKKCERCQSSIWCQDSNSRPLEHKSPPITTR